MLYGFIGTDTQTARRELKELLLRLTGGDSSVNISRFDDQNFNTLQINEEIFGQNLFGGLNVIILDSLLDHPDGEGFYNEQSLDTNNIILIRETAPKKAILGKLEKTGEVKSFQAEKSLDAKKFGDFALANAVIARNKKAAWVEFEKSRRRGEAMEAIHGMLFWALKTMLSVATLPKDEVIASGVKSFTYTKVKTDINKYQSKEILTYIDHLKDVYHKAHRGECDMETSLEQFILKL
jgi:DNA polymerase III delta subunit